MKRLPPLPTLKDILRMYGIRAQKKLSQNFLLDPKTSFRLSQSFGSLEGKTVIEVGPGPGGITRAILQQNVKELFVIEKDPRFLPSLNLLSEASDGVLKVKMGDCLHFNIKHLFDGSLKKSWDGDIPDVRLIGNLPFNVATPFIIKLLINMHKRDNIFAFGRVPSILTFQHEVAYRMIAPPSDKERCRLSVMAQNYAKVHYKYTLPGAAFVPAPNVNVGIVVIIPHQVPYIDLPFKFLERIVTTIMMHKQKTVFRTSLRLFPKDVSGKMADHLFEISGVDKKKCPIDLTMDEFAKISYTYQDLINDHTHLKDFVNRDVKIVLDSQCISEQSVVNKARPKYQLLF